MFMKALCDRLKVAVFGLSFFVAACATPPETIDPGAISEIKRVGVVSLIQNKLSATQATGILAFSNEHYDYDISDWALQATVEEIVRGTLVKSGRFEVVPLSYDPVELWQKYTDKHSRLFVEGYGAVGLVPLMKEATAEKKLDAIVAAIPGFSGRHCYQGEACAGYGEFGFGLMLRRSGPLGPRAFTTYVSIDLSLLDAATGKPLALIEVNEHRHVTLSGFAGSIEDYKDAEQAEMRESIEKELMPYIGAGLNRMRLTY